MANFETALMSTLKREGGFVNDPADSGGMTYRGISRKSNKRWVGWPIIDAMLEAGNPASLELRTLTTGERRAACWSRGFQGRERFTCFKSPCKLPALGKHFKRTHSLHIFGHS